jgi:hypothetical protein
MYCWTKWMPVRWTGALTPVGKTSHCPPVDLPRWFLIGRWIEGVKLRYDLPAKSPNSRPNLFGEVINDLTIHLWDWATTTIHRSIGHAWHEGHSKYIKPTKANNKGGCWLQGNLRPIYQPTRIIVSWLTVYLFVSQNLLVLVHKLVVSLQLASLLSSSLFHVSI